MNIGSDGWDVCYLIGCGVVMFHQSHCDIVHILILQSVYMLNIPYHDIVHVLTTECVYV